MRYENLLNRAARIVWRRPWLWLLALLAGETYSGGGGGGNTTSFQRFGSPNQAAPALPDLGWVPQWLTDRAGLIIEGVALLAVLAFLWFLLSCAATGALIATVDRVNAGESVSFGAAWRMGLRSFWRVLGLKLLVGVLVLLPLLLLAVAPLVGLAAGGSAPLKGLLLDLPLVFVYLFWVTFVGWLAILAVRACILDRARPVASLRTGFRIWKERFPRVALTGVILWLAGIGIGLVLQLVLALVTAPFLASLFDEIASGRWSQVPGTLGLALLVAVPVSAALSSAAGAWYATVWTVAYRRFEFEGLVPEPVPLPG